MLSNNKVPISLKSNDKENINNEKGKLSPNISIQEYPTPNNSDNQISKENEGDNFYRPLNYEDNNKESNQINKSTNNNNNDSNNSRGNINKAQINKNIYNGENYINSSNKSNNEEDAKNAQSNQNISNSENHINSSNESIYNKEEPEEQFKDLKTFISRYKKPPRTRLENKNQMSDLNSVIQAFGQIIDFAFYFLNPKNIIYINSHIKQNPLSFVTSRFFMHCYPYPERPELETYNLNAYSKVLASLNMLYKSLSYKLFNPNDLLIFILDILDKELDSNRNYPRLGFNKYNMKETIQINIKNYFDHQTVISKTLNWFQLTESRCLNCKNSNFKFLSFSTFNLDISHSYMQNQKIGKNEINIYDCLNKYQETTYNNLRCEKCNNTFQKIASQIKIFNAANHFIFLLDRGINFDKANVVMYIKFTIEEKIDLNNFIMNPKSPKNFELTGIVSVFLEEKKYICFSKSPIDGDWICYNDEKVEFTSFKEILEGHNDKSLYIPCILIYKSIKEEAN